MKSKLCREDIFTVATFNGSDLPLGIDNQSVVSVVRLREVLKDLKKDILANVPEYDDRESYESGYEDGLRLGVAYSREAFGVVMED